MHDGLNVIAVAALAAFVGVFTDSASAQTAQAQDAAAAVDAPMPQAATTQESPAVTNATQPQPAAAAAVEAAAAGTDSATPATAASPASPGDAVASQPITLKMATVPPPADFKVPAGYRTVKRGLDTVYCTSITPIGSKMPQTFCLTQGQVIERQRQDEVARRDVAQKSNVAGTPSGP